GDQVYLARVFQTFGLTESGLDEMVAGAIDPSEGRVSFRASFPEISLRVVVHGRPDEARARLDALAARIRARIDPYVYGEGAVTRRYQLWGTRDWVKLLASQVALDWMRRHALALPVTESRLFRPKDAGGR